MGYVKKINRTNVTECIWVDDSYLKRIHRALWQSRIGLCMHVMHLAI